MHASIRFSTCNAFACALILVAGGNYPCMAADDLHLRAGISFTQDIDSGFPIEGSNLNDVSVPAGTAAIIFFGASGDLNTNRQAKRFVDLYKKTPPHSVKFIAIDVDHPANDDAKHLIKTYYKGYIPFETIIDKKGKQVWSQIGEVETNTVKSQLDKL